MPAIELVDTPDLGNYYTKAQSDALYAVIAHDHNALYYTKAQSDVNYAAAAHTHTFASKDGITGVAGVANANTFLRGDGNWAIPVGVTGGADTQFQYNNAGAFAGADKLTWDNTNGRLFLGGSFLNSITGLITSRRLVVGNDVSGYGRGIFLGKVTVDTGAGGGSIEFSVAKSDNVYTRLFTVSGEVTNASALNSRKFIITDNQLGASVLEINQFGVISLGTWNATIIASTYGGTGSAFFAVAGPTVARTYTFPDANATILTTNALVTTAQGGTGSAFFAVAGPTVARTYTFPDANATIMYNTLAAAGDLAGTYPNPTIKASVSLTTPVIGVATGTSLTVTGALLSSGTAGIGYSAGAGGTVAQATSKSTGVTLNKICGQVTMNAAALAAAAKVSFVVTNSTVVATDIPQVSVISGGTANAYRAHVSAVAAGSFTITVENITAGSLSESPVIGFFVNKAVNA